VKQRQTRKAQKPRDEKVKRRGGLSNISENESTGLSRRTKEDGKGVEKSDL